MASRPDLAKWVGLCVGLWSDIELQIARLFAAVLGTSAIAAVGIKSELTGRRQEFRVIKAAAEKRLNDADLKLFKAAIAAARGLGKKRDKIAHWHWGQSDQLPDALLLVAPEIYLDRIAIATDAHQTGKIITADAMRFPLEEILVYRESDFEELYRDLTQGHKLIYDLVGLISRDPSPSRDELYAELSQRPLVLAHLQPQGGNRP